MYRPISVGYKGFFVLIVILAAIFSLIYDNYVYGAEEKNPSDKKFRSEEELIDETRSAVDKYLKETTYEKAEAKSVIKSEGKPAVTAATKTIKEEPAAQKETTITQEKKIAPTDEEGAPATVTNEGVSADAQSTTMVKDFEGNLQPAGEELDYSAKDGKFVIKPAMAEPVLKKMDVNKIGATPYYETYEGLRLLKYFTVAQRVEIYQEARPVDSYIMDAFAMRQIYPNTPWNIKSDYRTQLTPIFTRAYGTEITISDPKNKEGQIRYTHDYREIYKNYFPKYQYSALNPATGETIDNFLKEEMWDQNEVLIMHSKQIEPIGWNYTSNFGYRYSTMDAKTGDPLNSYYNIRHTYFGSLSLAPTDKFEWFGQAEYYKSQHLKSSFSYSPDHFLGRTELRIKSNDMKTMYVPSFSYSKDYYYPFADTYQKYEIYFRVGRDFTKRFSAASTVKYVMGLRDAPDNTGPSYVGKNPLKDKAYTIALENRFSYNVYDRLYIQAGADISNGLNWSIFDNFAMLAGLEYYAPGMIRVDVGWTGNYYYNLQDFMSSIYFKFYLFM